MVTIIIFNYFIIRDDIPTLSESQENIEHGELLRTNNFGYELAIR